MKQSQIKVAQLTAAGLLAVSILLGGILQTFTLTQAQKMAKAQRQQIVYILANRVAQLLGDAGSGMGGFTMTRMPMYAEKFNRANEALPKAMEDLGEMGPFEGTEAEAVSQLKQSTSESMALLAKIQAAVTNPEADAAQRHQGFAAYRAMKGYSDKIQACVTRLSPLGGPSGFLQAEKYMENETNFLRMLTVVWLVASLLLIVSLVFVLNLAGQTKQS
jgi:CHASE3 domain sensor protein